MNTGLSLTLTIVGIVIAIAALAIHFLVKTQLFPHVNIYLAVIAVILIGVGVWGMVSSRTRV